MTPGKRPGGVRTAGNDKDEMKRGLTTLCALLVLTALVGCDSGSFGSGSSRSPGEPTVERDTATPAPIATTTLEAAETAMPMPTATAVATLGPTPTAAATLTQSPKPTATSTLVQSPSGDAASDRAVLVTLYNATNGQNWFRKDNWLSDRPMNEWEGVRTDSDGRVTELLLYNNGLIGEIPPELAQLSNLRRLLLYGTFGNELIGEIPVELAQLSNLEELNLSATDLSGGIPAELGQLSSLVKLDLTFNALSGEIPADLGQLSNLTEMERYSKDLIGEIPVALAQLSNLEELNLSANDLSRDIRSELGGSPIWTCCTSTITGWVARYRLNWATSPNRQKWNSLTTS